MSNAPVVEERHVRLLCDDAVLYEWSCTPTDLTALALGRLFIDGLHADAAAITKVESGDIIELRLATAPAATTVQRMALDIPDADRFSELFRELFAGVDARHEHGGMHAAALTDGSRIVVQAEDVGRHNTVDKVIGAALLAGLSPAGHGMIMSSRISGEIARKAARAGVSWLASRSIPTTLAVHAAHDAGMPIIGRAAGRNAFVYR